MPGKKVGYIRVSTVEQNPERQLEGIELDKKFIEYASASSTNRPQLQAMIDYVRDDDIVFVHSMDRLARNMMDLKRLVDDLVKRNIQVIFVKENLTFCAQQNAVSNLILYVMGAFAEFEYNFMRERQREGIIKAQKAGKYKGRKTKYTQEMVDYIKEQLKTTRKPKTIIAKEIGISMPSFYNYMKKANQNT